MKTAVILGAVAAAAVGAYFLYFRRRADLAAVRNDAAGPRLPAMPAMPAMPSMPGMPTMPSMGNAPNAPQLAPGFGFGPQAPAGLFKGMWG
jgi:hypothetical protein